MCIKYFKNLKVAVIPDYKLVSLVFLLSLPQVIESEELHLKQIIGIFKKYSGSRLHVSKMEGA